MEDYSADDYIASDNETNAPESMTETYEETKSLLESIKELPEDRQQLLILKFVERLSNAEIGVIMDRTEGIKSLYHRTLLSLRAIWMNQTAHPKNPLIPVKPDPAETGLASSRFRV